MNTLRLIGRSYNLFDEDLIANESKILELVSNKRFLVIGGAGSIGQAVTREIFKRNPRILHVIDISENNLVELVRDIRSTLGYIEGDFSTFVIDCGSYAFDVFMQNGPGYDYVLNLSALKHVRSEKDPFSLMRMIEINILNTIKTIKISHAIGVKKYFCVSTDKAANPVNMMGASKRIMELFLMREGGAIPISTARFANVAFSDGSLLHGFQQRLMKRQPISAPIDIQRYFITAEESGVLCLMSCMLGQNKDIFFPQLRSDFGLLTLSEVASRFIESQGYVPHICESESEARAKANVFISQKQWPCYFFESDTTGEKSFEEFYTESEILDLTSFSGVGVIKSDLAYSEIALDRFLGQIEFIKKTNTWTKGDIISIFSELLPNFSHIEKNKYLDNKM